MTTQTSDNLAAIQSWVSNWLLGEGTKEKPSLKLLAGDGSPRRFFRVTLPTSTYVLLDDPDWTLSKDYARHQEYLSSLGIPVPTFFKVDPEKGRLLMEDVGDELLQRVIEKNPSQKEEWLVRAATLLARLHGKSFPTPSDLPASKRRFDQQKYREELLFTEEHLVKGFLGENGFSRDEHAKLESFCALLENIGPFLFSHRDYHARNLLSFRNSLYVIDFQDARLGPPHYDLASLVFDPYSDISDKTREVLVHAYEKELSKYPLHGKIDWKSFGGQLKAVAFQRIVKAAGSYASFFTRYGKKVHFPYLVPALKSALALESFGPVGVFPLSRWISKAESRIENLS